MVPIRHYNTTYFVIFVNVSDFCEKSPCYSPTKLFYIYDKKNHFLPILSFTVNTFEFWLILNLHSNHSQNLEFVTEFQTAICDRILLM